MQRLGLGFGFKGLTYTESYKVLGIALVFSTVSLLGCTALLVWVPEPWETTPVWLGEFGGTVFTAVFWMLKALFGLFSWLVSFRFLMVLFLGTQLNRLIDTMAAREQGISPVRPEPSTWKSTSQALFFLTRTVRTHLKWLPVYLVSYVFGFLLPFVPLFIFWWVDGKLLSREYFLVVGPRFIHEDELERRWESYHASLRLWGVLVSFLMSIPVFNMLAPLFATYSMVYVLGRDDAAEGHFKK